MLDQTYKRFTILFVDDASGYDQTTKHYIRSKLNRHIVVFNTFRKFSVRNAYEMIHAYAPNPEAVVVNLDGDDWLYGKNVLGEIAKTYNKTQCLLTYGNSLVWDGNGKMFSITQVNPYVNTLYPKSTVQKGSYRKEPFRCSHIRTWKVWLYNKITKNSLQRIDGTWLQYCEDQAMYYPMLEMAAGRAELLKQFLYVYNKANPHNDVKMAPFNEKKDELVIRKKQVYEKV